MNIKREIEERGINCSKLCELGNFKRSTYFSILNGGRKLSKLEFMGLKSLPKVQEKKGKER